MSFAFASAPLLPLWPGAGMSLGQSHVPLATPALESPTCCLTYLEWQIPFPKRSPLLPQI